MTQQSLHLLAARFLGQHVGSTAPLFLAFLAVHVVAGTTAVITGATAALAHKPGLRHLQAGRRYYRAITVLSGTGAALAIMRWREDAYLLVIAAVMFTAATIGVRARRRRGRAGDTIHILGLSLSFVAMMTGFYVDNGPHLPLLDHLPAILFWVLPSAVGAVLTGRAVRRSARGHYGSGGHHLAIIPAGTAGTPGTEGPAGTIGPVGVATTADHLTLGAVQGKQPPRRVTGVQQHQRQFAEFYAATRDDCLRVVPPGKVTAGHIQAAWQLVPGGDRCTAPARRLRGLA